MSDGTDATEADGFPGRYAAALGEHVRQPGEHTLRSAYELGRRARDSGYSMLELLGLHLEVRRQLVREAGVDRLRDMDEFLLEGLVSFEMSQRAVDESRAATATERDRADWMGALTDTYVAIAAHDTLDDRLQEVCAQTKRFFGAPHAILTFGREAAELPSGDVMSADLRGGARLDVIAGTGHVWTDHDRTTLRQLAVLISAPVDDARRLEFAQRTARLGRLLGGLVHPGEVLTRLSDRGAAEIGADRVSVHDDVTLASDAGLPDAVATGTADFHTDPEAQGRAAWAALPLRSEDAPRRVLLVGFDDPQPFDEIQRAFLRDVAARVAAALERSAAYARERSVRRELEIAAARRRELQELAAQLGRAATTRQVALHLLRRSVAATSAAGGLILARDGSGPVELATSGQFRRLRRAVLGELGERPAHGDAPAESPTGALTELSPSARDYLSTLGIQVLARYAVTVRATEVAALYLGWRDGQHVDRSDHELVQGYVDIAGPNLQRAERFDVEHEIANTLQRSIIELPPLALPGVRWSAHYRAGSGGLAGGDWYDLIPLDDDRLAIAVGDIVGRGVQAAAAMGQVRSATRALAGVIADPAELVTELDRLTSSTGQGRFSSLVYAVLDTRTGDLTTALAGHPPPILRFPDCTTSLLDEHRGPLLGLPGERRASLRRLPRGTQIVAYTDGLVERRERSIDRGIEILVGAVGAERRKPDELCTSLAELAPSGDGERTDDVAFVVVELSD